MPIKGAGMSDKKWIALLLALDAIAIGFILAAILSIMGRGQALDKVTPFGVQAELQKSGPLTRGKNAMILYYNRAESPTGSPHPKIASHTISCRTLYSYSPWTQSLTCYQGRDWIGTFYPMEHATFPYRIRRNRYIRVWFILGEGCGSGCYYKIEMLE